MKLNALEFLLMNNPIRAFIQEKLELAILMKIFPPIRFDSVLEIGCGNGHGTRLIRKYFRPASITAIDLDEKMIRIAKATTRDPSINFKVMDASRLNFPDKSFDAVFDFGIIHHIPNWRDCVSELRRVLKKGGKLFLEELSSDSFSGFPGSLCKPLFAHPYEQMFCTGEFIRYLTETGFEVVGMKESNFLKMISFFSLVAGT